MTTLVFSIILSTSYTGMASPLSAFLSPALQPLLPREICGAHDSFHMLICRRCCGQAQLSSTFITGNNEYINGHKEHKGFGIIKYGHKRRAMMLRMSLTPEDEDEEEEKNKSIKDYGFDEEELFDLSDETLLEILGLPDSPDSIDDETDENKIDRDIHVSASEELKELSLLLGEYDYDIDDDDSETFFYGEDLEGEDVLDVGLDSGKGDALRPSMEDITLNEGPTSIPPGITPPSPLEQALLKGVVPATAGVGSQCLPGDLGFDPLNISTKNYFKATQKYLLSLIPSDDESPLEPLDKPRPAALILRDYREAEIRHGRLAMLAAILWPLQEIIDRVFLADQFGHTTFVYGGVTLPYISLLMTGLMMLLGYLDIYAAAIKDQESGDAFLPGECFWDPLSMLEGAPDDMKRNMQEREIGNGRFAMIAVLMYILQEGVTHEPVINLPWNQILFEPAFEIPAVQEWLDTQFSGTTVEEVSQRAEILKEMVNIE